jgi:DNA sulfur modification protein DndD
MILDSLVLENVGVYANRQEARFSPDVGKPVVLIGGLNGGGKTTLLEAIQLALHGPRARIASRGALPYKEYLREAMHRGADPSHGASISLRFRRIVEGETRHYELRRSWRAGIKDIEESVRVWRDGEPDDILTEHWAEYIEGYLPSGIAHLFFFDGEQIKDLAEGRHAAVILGTAIQSLLGLDLVDRLESDLRVLERRKKSESLSDDAARRLESLQRELQILDQEQEAASAALGTLTNSAGMLAKDVHSLEEKFRQEGGDLYERRQVLEEELAALDRKKATLESELKDLAAGPSPLLLLQKTLGQLEQRAAHEDEIRKSRLLVDTLERRDEDFMGSMFHADVPAPQRRKMSDWLNKDVQRRRGLAKEDLLFGNQDRLTLEVRHLRTTVLPDVSERIRERINLLNKVEEQRVRAAAQIARVPTADAIARIQKELESCRAAHRAKLTEREAIHVRFQGIQRQKETIESQIDRLGAEDVENRFAHEDRTRILRHSEKVRTTLNRFKTSVIRRHTQRLERLILESFVRLLRKQELVTGLQIDPETFTVTLLDREGKPLPMARLSAGERQLLATSFLWGLARASGRPIPTVIDTPLGRLDSSHRQHLVDRYFPVASHQVILLSTDEEITGDYLQSLNPSIARKLHLAHDEKLGTTTINPGYFPAHETAN